MEDEERVVMNTTGVSNLLPITHSGIVGLLVVILILLVIGVVLNSFTIFILSRLGQRRNVFSYFLLSLCVANLISAILSPLFWYRRTIGFDYWQISNFLCKFYWGADVTTSCVTALHILAFAILRYIAITYPRVFAKISLTSAKICVLTMWLVGIMAVFIPEAYFNNAQVRNRTADVVDAKWSSCTNSPSGHKAFKRYIRTAFIILLYIPMLLIIVLSVVIAIKVKHQFARSRTLSNQSQRSGRKKENQAVFQLVLIVASFLLGYLPSAVYAIWTHTHERYSSQYAFMDYWGLVIGYITLRISECLDPVFYNIGNMTMRNETKKVLVLLLPSCGGILYKHGDKTISNEFSTKDTANTKGALKIISNNAI